MKKTLPTPEYRSQYASRIQTLADKTSLAAIDANGHHQDALLSASEALKRVADNAERRVRALTSKQEPQIAILPPQAPLEQVRAKRRRQAVKRGIDTYLPAWSDLAMGLPTPLLRSALFSCSQKVQANGSNGDGGEQHPWVAEMEIPCLSNFSITLSGYELCQFDRKVYATCLDYYREKPLPPDDSPLYTETTFYEFIKRMNQTYGLSSHIAVRASLLRLSFAQLRLQFNGWNIEVPKLLSVSFEDGISSGCFKAGDRLMIKVTESVASLFGPGNWTAVDKAAVGYDGLKGWIANFYAGHSKPQWLAIDWLREKSGYASRPSNFKKSLYNALDSLKEEKTPLGCRVSEYHLSEDGHRILVERTEWIKFVA